MSDKEEKKERKKRMGKVDDVLLDLI